MFFRAFNQSSSFHTSSIENGSLYIYFFLFFLIVFCSFAFYSTRDEKKADGKLFRLDINVSENCSSARVKLIILIQSKLITQLSVAAHLFAEYRIKIPLIQLAGNLIWNAFLRVHNRYSCILFLKEFSIWIFCCRFVVALFYVERFDTKKNKIQNGLSLIFTEQKSNNSDKKFLFWCVYFSLLDSRLSRRKVEDFPVQYGTLHFKSNSDVTMCAAERPLRLSKLELLLIIFDFL